MTPPDTRRRSAFTLLELLLVLALAVVLAAMAAPAMSGALARARLEAAAEQLATAWNEARLRAIRDGEPIAFRCELEKNVYRVSPLSAAMGTSVSMGAASYPAAQDPQEELGSVVFKQVSLGDPDDIPAPDPTVAAVIVFQPDGATSDAYVLIEDEQGSRRRVSLRGLNGAASIEAVTTTPGAF